MHLGRNITYKCLLNQSASVPSSIKMESVMVNNYILTESRNFKTFLKEKFAVALGSCYMFIKNVEHRVELDVDSA